MDDLSYKQINVLTYDLSVKDYTKVINQTFNIGALKRKLHEYIGHKRNIDDVFPIHCRLKLYIIESQISKLENNNLKSLNILHKALLCHTVDDVIEAIIWLLKNNYYHQTIIQTLIGDISKWNTTELSNALIVDINLPKICVHYKDFVSSPHLKMIRKYETSITKRLDIDHLSAGLSYIDMCMAVGGDPTCVASNFILAAICFYELMKKCVDADKAYAYRNVINDLSIQSFFLSRRYLPPHMQIYICKLAFTLMTKTSQLFKRYVTLTPLTLSSNKTQSKQLLVTKQQSLILSELLKNIVNSAKISPFIQLPTSLSYDTLYLELTGQKFLTKFLNKMANHKRQQELFPAHLYQQNTR
ncbi:unnamed protein product [Didymodactylos carnosus]|uniref:Uncharacterized protein n=1 Tax=Didymodactylos carnosus TaxID=1234261 RepID=A0A816CZ98_9BILA|nr:unnamed protein product [Didymodactylos carnosus]CAF4524198.1 unnamed protein product [Didymodactylos carnosus]